MYINSACWMKPAFFLLLNLICIPVLLLPAAMAGQVVITPDTVKAPTYKTSDSVCYGTLAHTHINLGFGTGGEASTTGYDAENKGYCTVGGGYHNSAAGRGATVGGGDHNQALGSYSVIGGGQDNIAGIAAVLRTNGKGQERQSYGLDYTTVGGGFNNRALGIESTVGGGCFNDANGLVSTISGGDQNSADGHYSAISGGSNNSSVGAFSAIPGGYYNAAAGEYSFAGGRGMRLAAEAGHTFAWGYDEAPQNISAPDAFLIFPRGVSGKVGIGVPDPDEKLHLKDTDNCIVHLESQDGANDGWIGRYTNRFQMGSDNMIQFSTGTKTFPSNIRMTIDGSGNVGIGTTSPEALLDVNGAVVCTSLTETSDLRYKENIQPLASSLDKVAQLTGVSFNWKTDGLPEKAFNRERQIGLVAQEVEPVLPELVTTDSSGVKSVAYTKLTVVLLEAVKELKQINEKQQKLIAQQQLKLEQLQGLIMKPKS